MLVALSDTHGRADPKLPAHLRDRIERADRLVHAGDFVTEEIFEEFEQLANRVVAVHGNSDGLRLRERLPETATAEWGGMRFLVVHGHRHDETSLSLLARQEEADVIVAGHTHRPEIDRLGDVTYVNPGSHTQPRGDTAAYAAFERTAGSTRVSLRKPTGTEIQGYEL